MVWFYVQIQMYASLLVDKKYMCLYVCKYLYMYVYFMFSVFLGLTVAVCGITECFIPALRSLSSWLMYKNERLEA